MWLTIVIPSILRAQWVHIRALSVDIGATGSFLGSLKGLAIAISLCDSKKHVISCSWLTIVVPSILRVQWVHTGATIVNRDASGLFWGSLKGL